MNFEYYEIPMDNIGENVISNLKLLLNKLHTYQDFCAKEEVSIQIGKNAYTFKLVKKRYLNVNNEDIRNIPLYKLEYIANECPVSDFISKYNIELRDYIIDNYINTGKIVRAINSDFYRSITLCDKSYKYDYFDFDFDETYIILKSVDIKMNRVWINYDEVRLCGDNWDDIEYNVIDNHDAVITRSWLKSEDSMDFITKDDLFKYINNKAKDAIFNFTLNINNTLNNIKKNLIENN